MTGLCHGRSAPVSKDGFNLETPSLFIKVNYLTEKYYSTEYLNTRMLVCDE